MKEQGADAVLITRIANRKTVYTNLLEVYAPPQSYRTWQNYYEYGYGNITSPNNVEETKYAVMETNMYDAGNDKLIWSASSETEITGTDQKFIRSYVNVMVKSMTKQKLLMRE
jgi:nitrate reductase beta subunit